MKHFFSSYSDLRTGNTENGTIFNPNIFLLAGYFSMLPSVQSSLNIQFSEESRIVSKLSFFLKKILWTLCEKKIKLIWTYKKSDLRLLPCDKYSCLWTAWPSPDQARVDPLIYLTIFRLKMRFCKIILQKNLVIWTKLVNNSDRVFRHICTTSFGARRKKLQALKWNIKYKI